jgi:DUF4097 and DUF4098 domain-containing protein YvlB
VVITAKKDVTVRASESATEISLEKSPNLKNIKVDGSEVAIECDALDIEVPPQTQLEVVTQEGEVSVDDLRVGVKVRNTRGNVRLEEVWGPIDVTTGAGDIEISYSDGVVHAVTRDGDIDFDGFPQGVSSLGTDRGNVHLQIPDADVKLVAHTGSGQVTSDRAHLHPTRHKLEGLVRSMGSGRDGSLTVTVGSGNIDFTGEEMSESDDDDGE